MQLSAVEALKHLGGSATLREALSYTSRAALRSALARGEVLRLAKGVYGLPEAWAAGQAAAAVRGVVSHQSAAEYWLMDSVFPPESAHVTVPRLARPRPRKGVVFHFAELDDERVTRPLRTVLDCARSMPFVEGLAIADSALRRDLVGSDELLVAAERLRGPGRQQALRVTGHADVRAANPFESAMRGLQIEAGLTGFIPQLEIPLSGGSIWVDLGDEERMIVMEADSFRYHGGPDALVRDCRRYDELTVRGWLVLRFAWEHIMFEHDWVRRIMIDGWRLRGGPTTRNGITPRKRV